MANLDLILEGKSPQEQNEFRKLFNDLRISDTDSIWPLIWILDLYARKNADTASQAQAVKTHIETNLKKELASYFSETRKANTALFHESAAKQLASFQAALKASTDNAVSRIETAFEGNRQDLKTSIEQELKHGRTQAKKAVEDAVKAAAKARPTPFVRAISFGVMVTLAGLVFLGSAAYFGYEGYALANGQPGLLAEFFMGKKGAK